MFKILNVQTTFKEAGLNEQESEVKKKPFIKINYIIEKLKEKDVQPALEWDKFDFKFNSAEIKNALNHFKVVPSSFRAIERAQFISRIQFTSIELYSAVTTRSK